MDYINQHRWPPLSYEQAMDEYRKKYLEEESDESAEEDVDSEGDGETEKDTNKVDAGVDQQKRLKTKDRRTKRIRSKRTSSIQGRSNKCRVM